MKVYTYSEARQRFAEVLNIARKEEVIIKRRGGETFTIIFKKTPKSPFDIPGIKTKATTRDILEAIKDVKRTYSRTCHFTRREEAWHYIGNFVASPYSFRALVSLSLDYQINMHAIHWTRPSNN